MRSQSTKTIVVTIAVVLAHCILGRYAKADATTELLNLLENVKGADAHRYDAQDTAGNTLANMSVLPVSNEPYKYVGLYHSAVLTGSGYRYAVHIGTSSDLINWTCQDPHQGTYQKQLIDDADMPYIKAITNVNNPSDVKYLVAYEQWVGNTPQSSGACRLGFKLYDSVNDILTGVAKSTFVLPSGVQLSPYDLEGTPNIYGGTFSNVGGHLQLNASVGFHYYSSQSRDIQGQGTVSLSNGSWSWSSSTATGYNNAFTAAGSTGNIGKRDSLVFDGSHFNIQEGNIQPAPGVPTDFSKWRLCLYDWRSGELGPFPTGNGSITPIVPETDGGSTAFGNPFVQVLPSPSGTGSVLFGNYFIFSEGAAPGEAGALVFYHAVPEPSTICLLLAASATLGLKLVARRRNQKCQELLPK